MAPAKSSKPAKNLLTNYFTKTASSSASSQPSSSQQKSSPSRPVPSKPKPKQLKELNVSNPRPAVEDNEVILVASDSSRSRTPSIIISTGSEGTPPPATRLPASQSSRLLSQTSQSSSSALLTTSSKTAPSRKRSHSNAIPDTRVNLPAKRSNNPRKLASPPISISSSDEWQNTSKTTLASSQVPTRPSSSSKKTKLALESTSSAEVIFLDSSFEVPTSRATLGRPLSKDSADTIQPDSSFELPSTSARAVAPLTSPYASSSASAKRNASTSPPTSPRPSQRRKTSSPVSPSKSKPIYILDDDEIVPSSEGDDELDLPPLDRSVSFLSHYTQASVDGLPYTPSSQPAQGASSTLQTTQPARRVSLTDSEMQVDMQLDDAGGMVSLDQDMEEYDAADEDGKAFSDTESIDSEKALERALNAKVESPSDGKDDIVWDDDLLNIPAKQTATPTAPTFKDKGKGKEIVPSTPARKHLGSGSVSARALETIMGSSPLTPSISPPHSAEASTRPDPSSPSQNPHRGRIAPTRQFVVEVPILSPSVASTYRLSVPPPTPQQDVASGPRTRSTRSKTPSLLIPAPAPPAPKKQVRLPKSAGSNTLDSLLKEKRTYEKKYADILKPLPEENDGDLASPVMGSSRATTAAGPEPATPGRSTEMLQDLLEKPDKIGEMVARGSQQEDPVRRREEEEREASLRSIFWNSIPPNAATSPRTAPPFPDVELASPLLKALKKTADDGDANAIAVILQVVSLSARLLPDEVVDWLLDLAVFHHDGELAYASLTCLQDLLMSSKDALQVDLDFSTIRRFIVGLGANDQSLALLPVADEDGQKNGNGFLRFGPQSTLERFERIGRLVSVVSCFARSNHIYQADIPQVVLSLLLMAQDPSVNAELRDDISAAIQLTLKTIDRAKEKRALKLEMQVCSSILAVTEERSALETLRVLRIILPCDQRAIRITRWIAICTIAGPTVLKLSEDKYMQPPPCEVIASLLLSGQLERDDKRALSAKFRIDSSTNYWHLSHNVELLGLVLMDIASYKDVPGGRSNLIHVVKGIDGMTARIVEKSSNGLERTSTKGEIQRLKIRVTYQITEQGGMSIYDADRKVQTDIKSFFSAVPK